MHSVQIITVFYFRIAKYVAFKMHVYINIVFCNVIKSLKHFLFFIKTNNSIEKKYQQHLMFLHEVLLLYPKIPPKFSE